MNTRVQYRDIMKGYSRVGNHPALGFSNRALARQVATVNMTEEEKAEWYAAGCPAEGCCEPPPNKVESVLFAGFKSKCIGSCGTVTLEAHIQAQASIIGLFVPPDIATALLITDFRAGLRPLLGNCEGISAAVFACCEMDVNAFNTVSMYPNTEICVTFKNRRKQSFEIEGVTLKLLVCQPC